MQHGETIYTFDQPVIHYSYPEFDLTIIQGYPPMSEDDEGLPDISLNTTLPIAVGNTADFIQNTTFGSITKFQVVSGASQITSETSCENYNPRSGNSETVTPDQGSTLQYSENLALQAKHIYWIFYGNTNNKTGIQMALFKTDSATTIENLDFITVENGQYFIYDFDDTNGTIEYIRLYPDGYSQAPNYYLTATSDMIQTLTGTEAPTVHTISDSKFYLLPTLPATSLNVVLIPDTIPITEGNSASLKTHDRRDMTTMYIFSRTDFSGLPASQTILYFYYYTDSSHKGYTERIPYSNDLILEQNYVYLILRGDYTTTSFQFAYFIPGKENFHLDYLNWDLNDNGSFYIYRCPVGYDAYYLTPTVNNSSYPAYFFGLQNIQTETDEIVCPVYVATDIGLKMLPQSN